MSSEKDAGEEQRNFFRLQEQVALEYRAATLEEVQEAAKIRKGGEGSKIDATFMLDAISRQLMPLLANVRAESPAIAQYLEGLNQKLDVIAGMVFFHNASLADSSGNRFVRAKTVDISEGGLSFDTPKPPKKGSFVFCRVSISGFQLGLQTYAKVVYLGTVEDDPKMYRVGVSFPLITDYERKQLTRFIFDRQREQIRQVIDGNDNQ
ncbi:MAG: PilZ domain-containing protein [Gammaproteobacteria bacterium]|nr:PilZ domain-containing protein [Gammaproteobacteria bacterium]